jgi:molybdenum cofactor biosynthesis enzyme MoaA
MLYTGLKEIIKKLASAGVSVILYTNGITLTGLLPNFFPYLKFLSLPLDAISWEGAQMMRGYDQIESVQRILREIKKASIQPRVKLGTVVSNLNCQELPELANFVMRTPVINIWRLYQYSPGGIGLPQAKTYSIDNWKFEKQITETKKKFVGSGQIISVRTSEEIIGYCMIMDAHGRFYHYDGVYHPLAVTLWSSTEEINREYNIEKHQLQKRWHNLTP